MLPTDKLTPAVAQDKWGKWAIYPDGTVGIILEVFADASMKNAADVLVSKYAAQIEESSPELAKFYLRIPNKLVKTLASEEFVMAIDQEPPPPTTKNDGIMPAIGANLVHPPPFSIGNNYNLDGTGVQVGIWDVGFVEEGHQDFGNRVTVVEPANYWPVYGIGDVEVEVQAIEFLLQHHGFPPGTIDQVFTTTTQSAVISFMGGWWGLVGPAEWQALIVTVDTNSSSNNNAVKALQSLLQLKYGYNLVIDGDFGTNTESAVENFQLLHNITVDGVVGPITWRTLLKYQRHATHVAGTVGGDGANSILYGGTAQQWHGVAPNADIVAYSINSNPEINHNGAMNIHGIDLSQNSWGDSVSTALVNCATYGDYTARDRDFDSIIDGAYGKRLPIMFAAGNERDDNDCPGLGNNSPTYPYYGNINGPGTTSKNTITVGAVNSNDSSMTRYSSWGPMDDGRLKPDIVAPGDEVGGDNIASTIPGGNNNLPPNYTPGGYGSMGGTSMATPAVSGSVALLLERYRQVCTNGSIYNAGFDPLPSAIKAMLIHGAQDLNDAATSWYTRGPDYASGYGLINVKRSVDLIPFHVEGSIDTNDLPDEYPIVVSQQQDLKVTLVWDDPAALNIVTSTLTNNLDLELIDPAGGVHQPWLLNPAVPANAAVRGVDSINVVEQVVVDQVGPLMTGTWIIRVKPTRVDVGPQVYSLVSELFTSSSCDGVLNVTPTDVWLRDTTVDNGTTPSQGVNIYSSPDVRVRQNPGDDGVTNENPEYGQTNYVYVDVRNDLANAQPARNVRVFVYYAHASTGLAWPTDWNLLGSETVVNLAAGSTSTVELPWLPPAPVPDGHFCLYVRLVTEQDPLIGEVAAIDPNVRNNNNIAWKNVTVVNLFQGIVEKGELIVRNVTVKPTSTDLVVYEPQEQLTNPFLTYSDIVLDLGGLYDQWEANGAQGDNIKIIGQNQIQILSPKRTVIRGIPMAGREEAVVSVIMKGVNPLPNQTQKEFNFYVEQFSDNLFVGGETYQVRYKSTLPSVSDVGDAPDSTNHPGNKMLAYPGVAAFFPTVYDNPATSVPGPIHWQPKADAWLGKEVSGEKDADLLPDQDGDANLAPLSDLANRDQAEDGLQLSTLALPNCKFTNFKYDVNIVGITQTRYANVWFDFKRDGDWNDAFRCKTRQGIFTVLEWAIRNYPVAKGPGYHTLITPRFVSVTPPTSSKPMWMRMTMSGQERAVLVPGALFADGRAATEGLKYGETEDYLLTGSNLQIAGSAGILEDEEVEILPSDGTETFEDTIISDEESVPEETVPEETVPQTPSPEAPSPEAPIEEEETSTPSTGNKVYLPAISR